MTRKHYSRFAQMLATANDPRFTELLIAVLRDEPNFNEEVFRAAIQNART